MKNKIKAFFEKNIMLFGNALLLILLMVSISLVTLLLLMLFDVVYFEDGMKFNSELFMSFASAWYG